MKRISLLLLGVAGMFGTVAPASADTISGTINFSGSVIYDNRLDTTQNAPLPTSECGLTNTNPTCGDAVIDFLPSGSGAGLLTVVEEANGYFSDLATHPNTLPNPDGITGLTILDINNFEVVPTGEPSVYAPAGTPLNIVGFLDNFQGLFGSYFNTMYTNLQFDLTEVVLQSGTPCGTSLGVGESCVLGPFVINQTQDGLGMRFDVKGWFRNPFDAVLNPTADEGFYQGSFGTTHNDLDYDTVYDRLANNGLDIGCGAEPVISNPPQPTDDNPATFVPFTKFCGFTANFNPTALTVVPEPATLATFGMGALFLAAYRRRQNRSKQIAQ